MLNMEKWNVTELIKPLTDENVLTRWESDTLKEAGSVNYSLVMELYKMIVDKTCQQQLRFFKVVRGKQPWLVTKQDIADLATSAWNWDHEQRWEEDKCMHQHLASKLTGD